MLDRLITHLSCLNGAAGVGSATMPLSATMPGDVEEVVVTEVVGALGAFGEVFELVTAAVLLVWLLGLVFAVFVVCAVLELVLALGGVLPKMLLNFVDETSTFGHIFI